MILLMTITHYWIRFRIFVNTLKIKTMNAYEKHCKEMSQSGQNSIIQIQKSMSESGLVNDEESFGDFFYLSQLLLKSYNGILSREDCADILNMNEKYFGEV